MSNKGLSRALRDVGARIVTCDVGDRRVVEALRRDGLRLGGEQSGHIVFGPDNHYIGDGLYTALAVLRVLRARNKRLSELAGAFRAFPQVLINVRVREKPPLTTLARVSAAVKAVENALGEDGRVLLRYSGTEALARVMVEGPEEALIRAQAMSIADELKQAIGA
jgi:phosphoglucosamine mutase